MGIVQKSPLFLTEVKWNDPTDVFFVPRRDKLNPTDAGFKYQKIEIPFRDTTSKYVVNFSPVQDARSKLQSYVSPANEYVGDPRIGAEQWGVWAVVNRKTSLEARQFLWDLDSYKLHLILNELGYSQDESRWSASESQLQELKDKINQGRVVEQYRAFTFTPH